MLDVITKCWDANPLKRPNADELHKSLENFRDIYYHYTKDPLIHDQIEKADEINKRLPPFNATTISNTTHHLAVYTGRQLDFEELIGEQNFSDCIL